MLFSSPLPDLKRRQEELRRLEELRNQELQRRKQIEMRSVSCLSLANHENRMKELSIYVVVCSANNFYGLLFYERHKAFVIVVKSFLCGNDLSTLPNCHYTRDQQNYYTVCVRMSWILLRTEQAFN